MPQPKTLARILFCALALAPPSAGLAVSALAEEPRVELRYDLRPGDHLVYRQVFERDGNNSYYGYDFLYRREWTSHVLVTGEQSGSFAVGFQRNRTRDELLRFQPRDKSNLEEQRQDMIDRLARTPTRYAEANRLSPHGWPKLPWQVLRESWSEALFDRHELEALPTRPVRPGDSWTAASMMGIEFRASGWDRLRDQDCLRVDGTASQNTVRLRYWFCPASGTLARLEFDTTYPVFGGRFQERLTLELVERRRNEDVRDWLTQPKLQQGALAALLVSESLSVEPAILYALLETDDGAVQRQVLALAYRHRLAPPPVESLTALFAGDHPRVRVLAVRLLEGISKDAARPLIRRALADADYFVRQAALAWVRARLPAGSSPAVNTAKQADEAWDSLSNLPLESPSESPLAEVARAVETGGVLQGWSCGKIYDWSSLALQTRRFPGQAAGTTARWMTTEGFLGWPYVVHVPEDYRGDEPFPLLIYLSGDSGRAMHGVRTAYRTVPRLGYLTVFPQAGGYWHDERPTAVMMVLWKELLRTFNVDTNRVYLAGLSNGGTGAAYFASFWNDRLAAAVPMMGAGVYAPDPVERVTSPEANPKNVKLAEPPLVVNLVKLPLLFLHGEKDKTIPPKASRETVKIVRRLAPDAPIKLHILKGRGHDILLDTDEGKTVEFFQQHLRDPFPRRVVFQSRRLRFPRRYWIEILDKGEGLAEVRGTIEDNNTIRVATRNVTRLRLLLRRELFPRSGPVRVLLNGKEVFAGVLPEDCDLLQRSWKETADPFRAHSAELTFTVPR